MKIVLTYDHAGKELALIVQSLLNKNKISFINLAENSLLSSSSDDYPDMANLIVGDVLKGALGIAICGSGQGVCISCNRYKGIRAVLIIEKEQIETAIAHNWANVLCLSGQFTKIKDLEVILKKFIIRNTKIENLEARHLRRIQKLDL
jgi:ribose 5-phosphate isomerase B